jgi:hypothetical protein
MLDAGEKWTSLSSKLKESDSPRRRRNDRQIPQTINSLFHLSPPRPPLSVSVLLLYVVNVNTTESSERRDHEKSMKGRRR